jgi:hypothetical protein
MKFKLLIVSVFSVITAGGITSCKYDDSELWNEMMDHENRIVQLESLCNQMNTNISSLQTIVSALQENDYVTSIIPITSGGETIGYTINFSKSGSVTIYNVYDGHIPAIGVMQSSDGNYYWTLDGNWLLDDDGNKVKANGTDGRDGQDGKDGITPKLKIEEGYWFISYDNGSSWNQLGKATGEDVIIGGDSMFSKVTFDEEFVYLVLADNDTTLIIPRRSDDFDLQFGGGNNLVCSSGETVSVSYTLTYGDENTEVAAIPHGGWEAKVEKTGNTSGTITVTAPNPMKDGEVIVLASDGNGKTIMKKLVFEEGVVSIVTKSYVTDSDQTTIEVELSTNLNYTVSIPDDAKSWISVSDIQTKTTMRNDVISLSITANISNSTRMTSVSFVNSANEVLNTITVSQTGAAIANNEIWYISSDGNIIEPNTYYFAGNIISNTYGNGKGVIIFEDDLTEIWTHAFTANNLAEITIPSSVTRIGVSAFSNPNLVKISIPESVTSIGDSAFAGSGLVEISIPESVTSIGDSAFAGSSLVEITIPKSVTYIGGSAFENCNNLVEVIIPESITYIESYTFFQCCSLAEVTIPESVIYIGDYAFYWCSSLSEITIPESVTSIGVSAFVGSSLVEITIPKSVTYIGPWAFNDCRSLESLYCKAVIPPKGGGFEISAKAIIYVPNESVEQYKSAEGWSENASKIVGYDFSE